MSNPGSRLGKPETLTTPAAFAAHPSISATGGELYSSVLITSNVARLALNTEKGTTRECLRM